MNDWKMYILAMCQDMANEIRKLYSDKEITWGICIIISIVNILQHIAVVCN